MAKNDNLIEVTGIVNKSLPNMVFEVEVPGMEHTVIAHLAGKLKANFIRVLPGDQVTLEVNTMDMHRGRIIWRNK